MEEEPPIRISSVKIQSEKGNNKTRIIQIKISKIDMIQRWLIYLTVASIIQKEAGR